MGQSESKHRVLYLPAQSGKTSKMEDLIRDGKIKHGIVVTIQARMSGVQVLHRRNQVILSLVYMLDMKMKKFGSYDGPSRHKILDFKKNIKLYNYIFICIQ